MYDPYLGSLGGGEKYVLTAAACLAERHEVTVAWDDHSILQKAEERFGLHLDAIAVKKNVFLPKVSFFERAKQLASYDGIFFVSDGSIPLLPKKKNILLFQFPIEWVKSSLFTRIKLQKISHIICYSDFVKIYIDNKLQVQSQVIPPEVDIWPGKNKKQNIILSVGRFTKAMNHKKQEVLVEAFKKMVDNGLKDWKLILAGGVLPEDLDFVDKLKKESEKYPIDIEPNIPQQTLINLYQSAKIYWHAAGYGEDMVAHPERAEHFGIATVEAMGQGTVPVVINAGGQKEIVTNKENGYLWNTVDELQQITLLLTKDSKEWERISHNARIRAKYFSKERFNQAMLQLFA